VQNKNIIIKAGKFAIIVPVQNVERKAEEK
jgi:hypothetical protein